nr:MAG TPA: hypothetical protein [Caudoviricetes sp.]
MLKDNILNNLNVILYHIHIYFLTFKNIVFRLFLKGDGLNPYTV